MKRLLIWLYMAIPALAFGQVNYLKGYIINNSGENIRGFINYRGHLLTPGQIQFKTELDGAPQIMTVENCAGYGVDDKEYFERFTTNISTAHTRTSMLQAGLDTTTKRQTVFLRVLQKGKNVGLYSYTDEVKERFFLMGTKDKEPYELFRAQYLDKNNSTILGNFKYRDQITKVLTSVEDGDYYDPLKVNELRYEAQDLLVVVSAINDQKVPKSKVSGSRLFAGLGLNFGKVSYVGKHVLGSDDAQSTRTPMPAVSAGVDIFLDPFMKRFIIRLELAGVTSKNKITSTGYSIHTFDQTSIAAIPQFIYNFYNAANLKMFGGVGMEFNYSSYSNNKPGRLLPPVIEGGPELYERQDITFEPTCFSVAFRAGMVIKKRFEVSAIYVMPSNVTNYSAFNVRMERFAFGVNYLFGRD